MGNKPERMNIGGGKAKYEINDSAFKRRRQRRKKKKKYVLDLTKVPIRKYQEIITPLSRIYQ